MEVLLVAVYVEVDIVVVEPALEEDFYCPIWVHVLAGQSCRLSAERAFGGWLMALLGHEIILASVVGLVCRPGGCRNGKAALLILGLLWAMEGLRAAGAASSMVAWRAYMTWWRTF